MPRKQGARQVVKAIGYRLPICTKDVGQAGVATKADVRLKPCKMRRGTVGRCIKRRIETLVSSSMRR